MAEDLFDGALNIEGDLYAQGYQEGLADGEQAGRLEGRTFGMTKGFEKFVQSSKLYGKSVVWANRLPTPNPPASSTNPSLSAGDKKTQLPPLPDNPSLAKNVETIHALMEPDTLPTQNSDEAVQDFDERLKKAQARAKVVEKMISGGKAKGEESTASQTRWAF
jgi:hypothetical protein